jgi:4'-phosphopantetheinyl transferase
VIAERAWTAAPGELRLERGQVDVWRIGLDVAGGTLESLTAWLCAEEVERAGRFAFPELRRRFVVARAALRDILGRYVGAAPDRIRLGYGEHGKPFLGEPTDGCLEFNLAHSGETALCAVTRDGAVGVDVERLRALDDLPGLAERCFSGPERTALARVAGGQRESAFFAAWTRKEAYVKALGDGLAAPLDRFDVTLAPGEPAALLAIDGDRRAASRWTLLDLEVGDGLAGAVAVAAPAVEARLLRWDR